MAEHCPERQGLVVIIGLCVLLRLLVLAPFPLTSIDIFRYVWDGRIQAAGFNPFSHVPAAPELRMLRDDVIFPYVDKADYAVTIYPPASQLLFLLVTRVHESVIAMKVALVAFESRHHCGRDRVASPPGQAGDARGRLCLAPSGDLGNRQ